MLFFTNTAGTAMSSLTMISQYLTTQQTIDGVKRSGEFDDNLHILFIDTATGDIFLLTITMSMQYLKKVA
jgi:hypothetical protein